MIRPDQAKFDQFSIVFEPIDEPLQQFAAANDLDYLRDVKRQPNRELHSRGNPVLMFGISLDGYWLHMDYHDDLLYSVGATGVVWPKRVLTTKSDERLIRQVPLLEHQPFGVIHRNLEGLLKDWLQLVTSWRIPDLTSPDEMFEAHGWQTGKRLRKPGQRREWTDPLQ